MENGSFSENMRPLVVVRKITLGPQEKRRSNGRILHSRRSLAMPFSKTQFFGRATAVVAASLLASCSDYNVNRIGDGASGADGLGVITGSICDPSGDGYVSSAEVWLPIDYDEDGQVDLTIRTQTDGDGRFELVDVPDGFWTVYVKKGSYESDFRVEVVDGVGVHDVEECLSPDNVSIAVVSGEFDTVQELLGQIGLEFDLFNGKMGNQYMDLLSNPEALESYDIVFLNCGINERWMTRKAQISSALEQYVKGGGSLYASDWSHAFVEAAFPNAVDWFGADESMENARAGEMGNYYGTVLDEGMQQLLGSDTADLYYDLGSWGVVEAVGPNTEVLIQGDVLAMDWSDWNDPYRDVPDSPLAVKFNPGKGTVIYTTFHNEPQTTVDMDILLKDIILSL